jgi:hypothetical protein
MKRGLAGLAVVALVWGGVVAGPGNTAQAARRSRPDWMVAWGPALPDEMTFHATVAPSGRGPLVVGAGSGVLGQSDPDLIVGPVGIDNGDRDFAWVSVYRVGGDGLSVRTKAGPFAQRIDVLPASNGTFELTSHLGAPHGRMSAVTVFVANGSFVTHRLNGGRPPAMNVRYGSGSRALSLTDGTGNGASVGPIGAAAASRAERSSVGLVGAFDVYCVACRGTFTGPNTSGSFVSAQLYGNYLFVFSWQEGQNEFAGPPGRWSFRWDGATLNDPFRTTWHGPSAVLASPVYAAYAPIGEPWKIFRGVRPWGVTGMLNATPDGATLVCETDALSLDRCR